MIIALCWCGTAVTIAIAIIAVLVNWIVGMFRWLVEPSAGPDAASHAVAYR
jgi:hypothetical protein